MAVPEAVDARDPQQDEDDPILVEGYRLAGELVKACEEQGRKRRLEAYGSNTDVQLATDTPCNAAVHLAMHTPSSTGGPGGGQENADKHPLGTLTVGTDRSVGRYIAQLPTRKYGPGSGATTPIRNAWLANLSRTRPTVGGTTRHGSSLLQPQGAFKV